MWKKQRKNIVIIIILIQVISIANVSTRVIATTLSDTGSTQTQQQSTLISEGSDTATSNSNKNNEVEKEEDLNNQVVESSEVPQPQEESSEVPQTEEKVQDSSNQEQGNTDATTDTGELKQDVDKQGQVENPSNQVVKSTTPDESPQPKIEVSIESSFKDNNLMKLIQQTLGVTTITSVNILKLTTLSNQKTGSNYPLISDLSGLENATNLKQLELSQPKWNDQVGKRINDLTPLAKLPNLTDIGMTNNDLTTLAPLATVTSLKKLDVQANSISDVGALANLTNMVELNVSNNQSPPIGVVANLTNLELLGWGGNNVTDISSLANLTKLSTLNIYTNKISDISSLSGMNQLSMLSISSNQISDLSSLKGKGITQVLASDNMISDISPLDQTLFFEVKKQVVNAKPIEIIGNDLNLPNPLIGQDGKGLVPGQISNKGKYISGTNQISWTGLPDSGSLTFDWANASKDFTGQYKVSYQVGQGQPVTVKYVDKNGVSLLPDQVLTGKVNEAYTSKAETIEGYLLSAPPTNATGVFTSQPQTVTYKYDGQLVFVSAPSAISSVGDLEIPTKETNYSLITRDNELRIRDYRGTSSKWSLKAILVTEMTSASGHVLKDSLFYRLNGKEEPFSVGNSIPIASETSTSTNEINISSSWSENGDGPLLKVKGGQPRNESYSAEIEWVLQDVPNP